MIWHRWRESNENIRLWYSNLKMFLTFSSILSLFSHRSIITIWFPHSDLRHFLPFSPRLCLCHERQTSLWYISWHISLFACILKVFCLQASSKILPKWRVFTEIIYSHCVLLIYMNTFHRFYWCWRHGVLNWTVTINASPFITAWIHNRPKNLIVILKSLNIFFRLAVFHLPNFPAQYEFPTLIFYFWFIQSSIASNRNGKTCNIIF